MKIILFIINFVTALYGSAPIFTTYDALPEDRQGQVYVTVDYGICLDDSGNGKLYGYGEEYNYISYKNIEGIKENDKIYTFCIMNPDNNYCDDILCRIDLIEETDEIFIDDDYYIGWCGGIINERTCFHKAYKYRQFLLFQSKENVRS